MRSGSWLLCLSLLLSTPAAARQPSGGPSLRQRTLVAPARPGEVPPLVLHVAAGVPTLLQLEAPLPPSTLRLPVDEARIRLVALGPGSWLLLLATSLPEGEQVPLTLEAGPGMEPLRFTLVTRPEVADVRVRVVRAGASTEDAAAESLALHLLATPPSRVALDSPRAVALDEGSIRARVESVLWMDRRFFSTAFVRDSQKRAPLWRLVQVRLRVTLADGSLQEWPARLVSGAPGARGQRYIFTGLLPESATHLEVAMDGEDTPGGFRPLPEQELQP
ncbi:DUF2381 family protein [Archangium lansingense]|uniref:DUF2381 family protein n=1 Tax=Archangium lansingense TaxID=2995310 RepID=A0ABT4APU2_9BACT|nr:DUF2381 family protein [Archangium lansinium]MCY1083717.1 DUF2381 family protein [Archangium lansinium]